MTNKYDIISLDKVDSTNSEAKKIISDIDNLSVVTAFEQTAGRGQRGNKWDAAPGENLTFSIVLKFGDFNSPPFQAYDQFAISQLTSLSVVDFLALHGIEAHIKWPNDIYAGAKKICGILIENSLKGDFISWSVIGVGINVNQITFDAPNATSMAELAGQRFDTDALLHDFVRIFEEYRHRYLHINGGLGKLRFLYVSQLWKMDEESDFIDYTVCTRGHLQEPVNVILAGENDSTKNGPSVSQGRMFKGIVRGISDTGQLVIEEKGNTREYGFKEIGWIIGHSE